MDKEICFLIDKENLFLDKVLVSFNDTPIFFVCCDNDGCYYLVLCTDIEELEYIIVKVSLQTIYRIVTQKIEMREPFVVTKHFWKVKASASVQEDVVCCLDGKDMDLEVLPYPGAMYETVNESDDAYVEQIKALYYSEADFVSFVASAEGCGADSVVELPTINLHPIAQYVELSLISDYPFTGVVKAFECSCDEKTGTYGYTEKMTQDTATRINDKDMNEILSGCIASIADAA